MDFKPPLSRTSLEAYNYRLQFPALKVENYICSLQAYINFKFDNYVVYKATRLFDFKFHVSQSRTSIQAYVDLNNYTVFMAAMISR